MYAKKFIGAMRACVQRMSTSFPPVQPNGDLLLHPNVALYQNINTQFCSTQSEIEVLWQTITASIKSSSSPDQVPRENAREQVLESNISSSSNDTDSEVNQAAASSEPLHCPAHDTAGALGRLERSNVAGGKISSGLHSTTDHTTTNSKDSGKFVQAVPSEKARTETRLHDMVEASISLNKVPKDLCKSTANSGGTFADPVATSFKKRKIDDHHDILAVKKQRTDPRRSGVEKTLPPPPSPEPKATTTQKRSKEDDEQPEPSRKRQCTSSSRDVGKLGRFDAALLDPALFASFPSSELSSIMPVNPAPAEEITLNPPYPDNLDSISPTPDHQLPVTQQTDIFAHIPGLGRLPKVQDQTQAVPTSLATIQNDKPQDFDEYLLPLFEQQYHFDSDFGCTEPVQGLTAEYFDEGVSAFAAFPEVYPVSSPDLEAASHQTDYLGIYPSPPPMVHQAADHFTYLEPEPSLYQEQASNYPVAPVAALYRGNRRVGSEYHCHNPDASPTIDPQLLNGSSPSESQSKNLSFSQSPLCGEASLLSYLQAPSTRKGHSAKSAGRKSGLPRYATLFEPVSSIRLGNKLAIPRILKDQVSPLSPISSRTPRSPIDDDFDEDDFRTSTTDISPGEMRLMKDKVLGKYRVSSNKKCPPSSRLRKCVTVIPEQEKWFMQELEHDLEQGLKAENEKQSHSEMNRKRYCDDDEDKRSARRSRLFRGV
ncbi:hypothetical protein ONS95_010481 [Cadophora gregata]|uniref:uncharacterized protein n=1 Tax=Cadophora gregata TaxID=51156 RepID=UPI0026DBC343|nr:uncharacterized protein ONS95_010481 [Cadophora gregata]KAK0122228.1 hypothetical protein ONS95_010481 [Cadophora gregata]KAK0127704.1 hypothetical protein ONS96_007222 [Cadophora gregata f. sp. sojae]